jgi:hypothetical protein
MHTTTPTRSQLHQIEWAAKFIPGEKKRPAQSAVYGDTTYSVEYFVSNRECYDGLPTPFAMFKINGKRVSRAVFYSHAAEVAA